MMWGSRSYDQAEAANYYNSYSRLLVVFGGCKKTSLVERSRSPLTTRYNLVLSVEKGEVLGCEFSPPRTSALPQKPSVSTTHF